MRFGSRARTEPPDGKIPDNREAVATFIVRISKSIRSRRLFAVSADYIDPAPECLSGADGGTLSGYL